MRAFKTVQIGLMLIAISLAAPGCVDDPVTITYPECVCADGGCGPETCGFRLSLHPNCNDDVDFAEVLVDDHVEETLLQQGETLVPCTRYAPGTKATVWIRGGSWIWGPLERGCEPGQEHTLILQCSEG